MKLTALTLFALTYVLLLALPKFRAYIALASASAFVLLGILPTDKILQSIDWNVILMIAGTMGLVSLFIDSKMPALLADLLIARAPNIKWAIIFLSLFSGIISAFVDNVATVLMVAPVALTIAQKLRISPVPGVIAIAVSSNLQGAATLVGDTTSILLGGYANLNFLDFFVFQGRIGLFWVVQAGALVTVLVLLHIFRHERQAITAMDRTVVKDFFPTVLLAGMVVLLIVASFIPGTPRTTNGIICVSLFALGLLAQFQQKRDPRVLLKGAREIDFFTLLLLGGLFVVVAGVTEAGVVQDIGRLFMQIGNNSLFTVYTLIVWVSVLFSAFIDNIPYVATMLPVAAAIANSLDVEPYVLYFGLLVGATLGGNLTPIGASANIAALGILRKSGYEVKAAEFMRIGIPFTLAAVSTGFLMVWLIWG